MRESHGRIAMAGVLSTPRASRWMEGWFTPADGLMKQN